MATKLQSIRSRLLARALTYPGASEHHPWGETVVKVGGKVFVFLGMEGDLGLSVKLGKSADAALAFPFATPTGYGLGKAGWVSAKFEKGDGVPEGLLLEWLDQSYRAVAPKKLIGQLPGDAPVAKKAAPARRRKGK